MPKVKAKRHFNRILLQQTNVSCALIEATCNKSTRFLQTAQEKTSLMFNSVISSNSCTQSSSNDQYASSDINPLIYNDNSSNNNDSNSDNNDGNENHLTQNLTNNECPPFPDDVSESSGISDDAIELVTSEDCDNNLLSLKMKLCTWAIKENISQSSLKKLLSILRNEDSSLFGQLPQDPRTLLRTPRNIHVQKFDDSSGSFYYFGVKHSIITLIQQHSYKLPENSVFEIAVNIDGLPISNSSNSSFWPILILIKSIDVFRNDVLMVGIYHGHEKAKNANNILKEFVNEATNLTNHGICINDTTYDFKIKMLICDAPAKAYVLSVKGHAANSACTKCKKECCRINWVPSYPDTNNIVKRTDSEFRQQIDEDYHTGTSLLTELPNFDMIEDVVLDSMHLIFLGVMKRLLVNKSYGWILGKQPYKLSFKQIETVSNHLLSLRQYIPVEFSNRKTRSLSECARYKAVEFKLLLLYTGPVVLKKVLLPNYYYNFLILHVATYILCSNEFCKNDSMVSYSNNLFKSFIDNSVQIYGPDFVSYNVHNLLHLGDDVLKFGNLMSFSAFPFENHMQCIKKMLRKSDKPLEQIIHRVTEKGFIKFPKNVNAGYSVSNEHFEGPLLPGCRPLQYKLLTTEKFTLKLNSADCYIQIANDSKDIVIIKNITYFADEICVIGQKFLHKNNFFTIPCESSALGIFLVNKDCLGELEVFPLRKIKNKVLLLPFENHSAVIVPFIHNM